MDPEVTSDPSAMKDLGIERNEVQKQMEFINDYEKTADALFSNTELIKSGEDPELAEMAREENEWLLKEKERLEKELRVLLVPKDPEDRKDAIVEIRAGAGGDEAGLFAGDLYRMYIRYAEKKGWKTEALTMNETGVGGYKEVVFNVSGENVYGILKFESGVHRVQRVPETESSGRIHTSAASVVVMPEAEDVDVDINPSELRIDVFRSSGPGGQSVNTTDSAVRITHEPSGIVVSCQDEKSQIKNKAKAMKVLRSRLLDNALQKKKSESDASRRSMVGSGDRSAKIRTYNFPQGRVTDHRINLTLHKLEGILGGDLDEVTSALSMAEVREKMKDEGA